MTSTTSSAEDHSESDSTAVSSNGAGLTDEQKQFLEQCEKEFANRYTDKDKEFVQFCSAPKVGPPVVSPWYSQPPRQKFGGGNDRRDSSRGWDRDRDRGGHRNRDYGDRHHHHDERDDRGRHEHDRDRGRYMDRRKY